MRIWAVFIAAILMVSSIAQAQRLPASSDEDGIHADWLDETKTLTLARFQRLLGLFRADSKSAPILDRAKVKLGVVNDDDLLKYVTLCSEHSRWNAETEWDPNSHKVVRVCLSPGMTLVQAYVHL